MHRYNLLLQICIYITSCSLYSTYAQDSKKEIPYQINYLDEHIFLNDSLFVNSKIGGLSGIEYDKNDNSYYIVCDDAKLPRFYKAYINFKSIFFDAITIDTVTTIKNINSKSNSSKTLVLEAIRILDQNTIIFASEGSIKHKKNPSIFTTDIEGNYTSEFELPAYFKATSTPYNTPRHNAVFEGLTKDVNNLGIWAAMELPLQLDGDEPNLSSSGAPVRITHFDVVTKKPTHQYTYVLDKLTKDPKGKFGVNGITGIKQLSNYEFLIIERGYSAGYGTQGNTVKIYLATTKNTTNTLDMVSLKNQEIKSATKTLLFDFESVRNKLTNHIVDNIEGITLGPLLANGNQSLLVIADNNFNPTSMQLNQLLLLELIKK